MPASANPRPSKAELDRMVCDLGQSLRDWRTTVTFWLDGCEFGRMELGLFEDPGPDVMIGDWVVGHVETTELPSRWKPRPGGFGDPGFAAAAGSAPASGIEDDWPDPPIPRPPIGPFGSAVTGGRDIGRSEDWFRKGRATMQAILEAVERPDFGWISQLGSFRMPDYGSLSVRIPSLGSTPIPDIGAYLLLPKRPLEAVPEAPLSATVEDLAVPVLALPEQPGQIVPSDGSPPPGLYMGNAPGICSTPLGNDDSAPPASAPVPLRESARRWAPPMRPSRSTISAPEWAEIEKQRARAGEVTECRGVHARRRSSGMRGLGAAFLRMESKAYDTFFNVREIS